MSTHPTPRPWEVKDDHMVIEPGLMTPVADCALNDYDEPDSPDRWQANAEHIVHVVNHWDELVAALERYATHANDCSVRQALGIRCDCGLSDVFQRHVLTARGEQP